jgi:hypothetical protein
MTRTVAHRNMEFWNITATITARQNHMNSLSQKQDPLRQILTQLSHSDIGYQSPKSTWFPQENLAYNKAKTFKIHLWEY